MPNKAWKQRERDVADFCLGQRNPLSGRNSKHTAADVIHDLLFIEVKLREKHSCLTPWDEVKKGANREEKTLVVCLCEKNRPGFWILVKSDDLLKL